MVHVYRMPKLDGRNQFQCIVLAHSIQDPTLYLRGLDQATSTLMTICLKFLWRNVIIMFQISNEYFHVTSRHSYQLKQKAIVQQTTKVNYPFLLTQIYFKRNCYLLPRTVYILLPHKLSWHLSFSVFISVKSFNMQRSQMPKRSENVMGKLNIELQRTAPGKKSNRLKCEKSNGQQCPFKISCCRPFFYKTIIT